MTLSEKLIHTSEGIGRLRAMPTGQFCFFPGSCSLSSLWQLEWFHTHSCIKLSPSQLPFGWRNLLPIPQDGVSLTLAVSILCVCIRVCVRERKCACVCAAFFFILNTIMPFLRIIWLDKRNASVTCNWIFQSHEKCYYRSASRSLALASAKGRIVRAMLMANSSMYCSKCVTVEKRERENGSMFRIRVYLVIILTVYSS